MQQEKAKFVFVRLQRGFRKVREVDTVTCDCNALRGHFHG